MKILLVGGTGVLSSAVRDEALRQNVEVILINRGNHKDEIPQHVRLIISDKDDYSNIEKQLKNHFFDAIVDFLCYNKKDIENSFSFYSKYTSQYFFISSCAVYHVTDESIIYEECSPKCDPEWDYSIGKYECEQLLIKLAKQNHCNYTIVRPSITYGDTRVPYGISPKYRYHWTLPARIKAGKPIIRWNEGRNFRNMMRVEDFAKALIGLVGKNKAMNEVFNICGDEAPTYNDVIGAIEEYLGKKAVVIDISPEEYAAAIPNRKGEILVDRSRSAFFSNNKVKEVVPGWSQTISIKNGIFLTLDSYIKNNFYNGIDYAFDGECDRIIKEISKKRKNEKSINLTFVDYLGLKNRNDLHTYKKSLNKNIFYNKFYRFVRKNISKLYHRFK